MNAEAVLVELLAGLGGEQARHPGLTRWSAHKDIAAKALRKLAGPHIPATLTRLEQAVERAHAAYDMAETAAREQQRTERQHLEDDEPVGDDLDDALDEPA